MLVEIPENEDQYLDPESIVKSIRKFLIAFSFLLFETDII